MDQQDHQQDDRIQKTQAPISACDELKKCREEIESLKNERDSFEQINNDMVLAIEKANQLAMDAQITNMAKSEFVARMSQQIKVPMNRIVGFTDLLVDTALDQTQSEFVHNIRQGAESLMAVLNTVVDFCKMGAGHVNLAEIDFDVEMLAYDVCDITRHKIESKPVALTCSIEDRLPARLNGDPQRFRQVLLNLMDNAAKFTDEGSIELVVGVDEEEDDRVKLHFQVKDTGIGIKKKKLATIFEAFRCAERSQSQKYGGAGLGLSLCQEIAALMGGDIEVESKLKQGSTFHFIVRANKSVSDDRVRISPVRLEAKKALVVFENNAAQGGLTHMLESFGMRVENLMDVSQIAAALERAAGDGAPFDILVIDLEVSEINVTELLPGMKQLQIKQPAMLAVSSSVDVVNSCRAAGCNGFLPKPIHRKKLQKMLERLVWQKREHIRQDLATQYTIRENAKHAVSVLLAAPDDEQAAMERTMLEQGGYVAKVVVGNAEAARLVTEKPAAYDIVMLDAECGFEPAHTAIKQAAGERLPVVAVGDASAARPAYVRDFLNRPLTRPGIFRVINSWVLEWD